MIKYRCFVKYGLDLGKNTLVDLVVDDSKLLIETKAGKYQIPYERIQEVAHTRETELMRKGKNMIGRAAAGGLLFGPVGAIVGGVTGIGDKKVKGNFVVVQYLNSQDEEAHIIFSPGGFFTAEQLAKKLMEATGLGDTVTL